MGTAKEILEKHIVEVIVIAAGVLVSALVTHDASPFYWSLFVAVVIY